MGLKRKKDTLGEKMAQDILPIMFFSALVCSAAFIFLSCVWKLIKLVSMRKLEEQVEDLELQQVGFIVFELQIGLHLTPQQSL